MLAVVVVEGTSMRNLRNCSEWRLCAAGSSIKQTDEKSVSTKSSEILSLIDEHEIC